jgi:hypothetical protein
MDSIPNFVINLIFKKKNRCSDWTTYVHCTAAPARNPIRPSGNFQVSGSGIVLTPAPGS